MADRPAAPRDSFWANPRYSWLAIPIAIVVLFVMAWGATRLVGHPTGETYDCRKGMNVTDDCDY